MIKRLVMSLILLTALARIEGKSPLRPPQALRATKQQDIHGYSIQETKNKTGNRLVLILKVGEPQEECPKMTRSST